MQSQYNNFDIKKQVLIILVFSSWTPLASDKEVNFYSNKFPYYARINEHVRKFHIKMELLEDLQVQSFVGWTYLADYFGSEPLFCGKDQLSSLQ